jgi:hypothetical protein
MAKRVKESRKEAAVVSKQANEVAKKGDLVARQEAQVRAVSGCTRACLSRSSIITSSGYVCAVILSIASSC